MDMRLRNLSIGAAFWIVGTIATRLAGQHLLHPDRPAQTVTLYAVSFVATGLLLRLIWQRLAMEKSSWPAAATLAMLPTLILDPFSCAFFPTVFPNVDPNAAGIFGGWMLVCCAGAVAAAWIRR
jgi:hypothetical protein